MNLRDWLRLVGAIAVPIVVAGIMISPTWRAQPDEKAADIIQPKGEDEEKSEREKEKLRQEAHRTLSGLWSINGNCQFAQTFKVKGLNIEVINADVDRTIASTMVITGRFERDFIADDDGTSVRLWREGPDLHYSRDGIEQKFIRCID